MVTTFVILGAGPLFGWLSDHVSRKLVLLTRGVANVFSSAIYLVAPNPLGVSTSKVLDDTGKAAFNPAWGAVMAQVSSIDRRSRARSMGYMSLGQDGGEIAGPILAGLLWSLWGVPAVMGVRIILAIAAELYSLAIVRPLLKKLESHQSVEQEGPQSANHDLPTRTLSTEWLENRRYQAENALLRELVEIQSSHRQVLQEELEAKLQDIQELQMLLQHAKTSSPRGRIVSAYNSAAQFLELNSEVAFLPAFTLRTFLIASGSQANAAFIDLTNLAERALYTTQSMNEEDARRAEDLAQAVQEEAA
jgi:MFS family permease